MQEPEIHLGTPGQYRVHIRSLFLIFSFRIAVQAQIFTLQSALTEHQFSVGLESGGVFLASSGVRFSLYGVDVGEKASLGFEDHQKYPPAETARIPATAKIISKIFPFLTITVYQIFPETYIYSEKRFSKRDLPGKTANFRGEFWCAKG